MLFRLCIGLFCPLQSFRGKTEKGEKKMTCKELAVQYRQSGSAIYKRMGEIKKMMEEEDLGEMEMLRTRTRLEILRSMYYETMGTARHLESYYI